MTMFPSVSSHIWLVLFISFTSNASTELTTNGNFSEAVMDFGLRLQNVMIQNYNGSNIVLSPTSIYGTLALSLLGSYGKTYNELVQGLNFADGKTYDHYRHRLLSEKLKHLNTDTNSSQTHFANGVFVDNSLNLRHLYKEFLLSVYNASVEYCNFSQGTVCKEEINRWISSKTNDKIQELLREPLSPKTKIIFASAIHFNGEWLKPFIPAFTQKLTFSPDVNDLKKDVELDMMLNIGKFKYSISFENDCELLALPYNDTKTTLYILKPINPRRLSIEALLREMTAKKISKMIEQSSYKNVVLRFPKMKVSSNWNLNRALSSLGFNSMFSPKEANFALIVDKLKLDKTSKIKEHSDFNQTLPLSNPGLFVDGVLHAVNINFDEFGTEAVAATTTTMARSAVTFYVNNPFSFFIINEETKLVTFSAVVFDPTK